MHPVSHPEATAPFSNIEPTRSSPVDSLLSLRVVRGPLPLRENETILGEYNKRIEPPLIPIGEFLHWVQKSPEGPAWHAILENESHGIVGHQCFIPLRANHQGRRIVAAKSEYTFLHEDFRTTKIRNFDGIGRPTHIVAAHQLALRCQKEGWGPLLISTIPSLRRRGFYGFIATDFPLWECLLVLRPSHAARHTPSLTGWQRGCLLAGGAVQGAVWGAASRFTSHDRHLHFEQTDANHPSELSGSLSFFGDPESLQWRYPASDYRRLALTGERAGYLIYKRGSENQYMRVCQWLLNEELKLSQIGGLVDVAQRDGAMGLRWAVYGSNERARALVQRLRRFGFLCVPRARTIQVKSNEVEFLKPENWDLTDAMFSFHW